MLASMLSAVVAVDAVSRGWGRGPVRAVPSAPGETVQGSPAWSVGYETVANV